MPPTLVQVEIKIKDIEKVLSKSKIESAIDSTYRIKDLEVILIGSSGREQNIGKKEIKFSSIKKNEEKKDGKDTYTITGYYRDNGNPFGYPGDGEPCIIKKAVFK